MHGTWGEVFRWLLQLPAGQAVGPGALGRLLLVAPGMFDMEILGVFLGLLCAGRLDPEDIYAVADAWLRWTIQPEAYCLLLRLPAAAERVEGQLSELLHKALQYGQPGVYDVLVKHPQAPLHGALLKLHLDCVPLQEDV